jgi:hypothetical protein
MRVKLVFQPDYPIGLKIKGFLRREYSEMKTKLFIFLLSLFFCGPAFATLCYVEFEPAGWSYYNDVFSFEQGIEIQYVQGCEDLLGYTVNLPSLILVNDSIYAQEALEVFDNSGSELLTAYVDTITHFKGLRTDIIFYDIDMTVPDTTYVVRNVELVLFTTGSKADTFEGDMTLTYIPEPATLLLLGLGVVMLKKRL